MQGRVKGGKKKGHLLVPIASLLQISKFERKKRKTVPARISLGRRFGRGGEKEGGRPCFPFPFFSMTLFTVAGLFPAGERRPFHSTRINLVLSKKKKGRKKRAYVGLLLISSPGKGRTFSVKRKKRREKKEKGKRAALSVFVSPF